MDINCPKTRSNARRQSLTHLTIETATPESKKDERHSKRAKVAAFSRGRGGECGSVGKGGGKRAKLVGDEGSAGRSQAEPLEGKWLSPRSPVPCFRGEPERLGPIRTLLLHRGSTDWATRLNFGEKRTRRWTDVRETKLPVCTASCCYQQRESGLLYPSHPSFSLTRLHSEPRISQPQLRRRC